MSGTAENPLYFATDAPDGIVNEGGAFAGFKQEDFAAFPLSGARDTYLTLGGTTFAGQDTDYSPTFLNTDGVSSVLVDGLTAFTDDNDGWYDSNPGTPNTGTSILIAQFTVGADNGGNVSLAGNIDGQNPDLMSNRFSAVLPGTGTGVLLGLAGLTRSRRRRAE